jgi:hypothetical protein
LYYVDVSFGFKNDEKAAPIINTLKIQRAIKNLTQNELGTSISV